MATCCIYPNISQKISYVSTMIKIISSESVKHNYKSRDSISPLIHKLGPNDNQYYLTSSNNYLVSFLINLTV